MLNTLKLLRPLKLIKHILSFASKHTTIKASGVVILAAIATVTILIAGTHHQVHPRSINIVSHSKVAKQAHQFTAGQPCQAAQISLGYQGQVQENMSQWGYFFYLQNTSKVSCTLDGYPKVAMDNVPEDTSHYGGGGGTGIGNPKPHSVTLTPNDKAYFATAMDSAEVTKANSCTNLSSTNNPTPVDVTVILPQTSKQMRIISPISFCPTHNNGFGYITAIGTTSDFNFYNFTCYGESGGIVSGPLDLPACPAPPQLAYKPPQPVTLMTTSGQSNTTCSNNNCAGTATAIPVFTPTTPTYVINYAFTASPGTTSTVCIYGFPQGGTGSYSSSYFGEICSKNSYSQGESGNFSVNVSDFGNYKPVQLNLYDASAWTITVTENQQPKYATIFNAEYIAGR